jgi:hypothetical protein
MDDNKKESNTIMQQINNFSLTPMNDSLAEQTIEDHKYLLELVENKCAIAFFAAINRNQSLYNALQQFVITQGEEVEEGEKKEEEEYKSDFEQGLEGIFRRMMDDYDFMSIVMYPDLKNRREFVHDCWTIAKAKENDELKIAITLDSFFYLTREDLLHLLTSHDNKMITHILRTSCKMHILEDTGYILIMIKGQQVDKNQHTEVELLDFLSVMI